MTTTNPRPSSHSSRHSGENWRDQWDRLGRWLERLADLERKHVVGHGVDLTYVVLPEYAVEEIDVGYAFMMNCFHLKDWLVRSASVPGSELEHFISNSEALSACADICHGVKHFELDRARSDLKWVRARGYARGGIVPLPFVLVAGRQHHLSDLARRCMSDWRGFLEAQGSLATTNDAIESE